MSGFKKGEYVITTAGAFDEVSCGKKNYCFKIRENHHYIRPEIDLLGSNTNGTYTMRFNKSHKDLTDWRYATDLEAAEYDRIGKPFDVTTLKSKFEVGKWYQGICLNSLYFIKFKEIRNNEIWASEYVHSNSLEVPTGSFGKIGEYKFNTLTDLSEIQQYLPDGHVDKIKTELTIDDLVEGEFVLPEKWCVKENKDKIVQQWFLDNNTTSIGDYVEGNYTNYYFHFPAYTWSGEINFSHANSNIKTGYAEITFDQFKKYFLKDEVVEKPKFEFEYGHWYTYSKSKSILYFATQNKRAYGFDSKGEWNEVEDRNFETYPHLWTKASQEDVEARLIEYAKKNYPISTKFRTKNGNVLISNGKIRDYTSVSTLLSIYVQENKDRYDSGTILTKNGEWAEIIKEEVKVNSKRAVLFESQAEWDFSLDKIINSGIKANDYDAADVSARDLGDGCKCDHQWCVLEGYEMLTFQQWLDEFDHNEAWRKVIDADFDEVKPEFKVGDWVVVVKKYSLNSPTPGNICKLLKVDKEHSAKYRVFDENKIYDWDPIASTGSWCCDVRRAKLSEIEEAKKRAAILSKPLIPEECFKIEPISPPINGKFNYIGGIDPIEPKLDLKDTKIWIGDNPELCEKVQLRLFELGYSWNNNKVQYTEKNQLFIGNYGKDICYGDSRDYFDKKTEIREITLQDLGLEKTGEIIINHNHSNFELLGVGDIFDFLPQPTETNIAEISEMKMSKSSKRKSIKIN